jgi:survival-of-motor-neuron-related-splicing factor 30
VRAVRLQWLEIKPTDDEKTVARKKKLLKSFKSKRRFQEMDIKQKERQSNWQSFLKGKGSKPKTGAFWCCKYCVVEVCVVE